MMPTTVINIKRKNGYFRHPRYVYIGRPSIWGNLFTHLTFLRSNGLTIVPTQEHAVIAFRDWVFGRKYTHLEQQRREEVLRRMSELEGKMLGCYCVPDPCHGNVYVDMLENGYEITIKGHRFIRESKIKGNKERVEYEEG